MDAAQALTVVRSLANGVDPESGEVFPPESAYQRPQEVRALYEAASALEGPYGALVRVQPYDPVRNPCSARIAAIIRTVEDLPLVPTTWIESNCRSGWSSAVISRRMRSRPNRIPNNSSDSR